MSTFKFNNVKAGDILNLDYTLTSLNDNTPEIKSVSLSSGITGTWNDDYTKFTVDSITGNSAITMVASAVNPFSGLSVGSTFTLGKYQIASEDPWDIEWEIVHQEDDYQIAMTKQIIDLRCFDAIEANNSDSNRKSYGNNKWLYANIEQWLNSNAEAGNWYSAQHSADAPPSNANVWSNYNEYDTRPGFLYHWTDEELAYLQDMTLTLANNTVTDGGGSYTWTGKVFLPTYTQMGFGQNNSISEGTQFSKFADATSRIKTLHPNVKSYNEYAVSASGVTSGDNWYYWMSSANPSRSYDAWGVTASGTAGSNYAYYGHSGLAPCIKIPR